MPRPKILHVVGDSAFGGASRIVRAIAVGARSSGYHVAVLATHPVFCSQLTADGVEVINFRGIQRAVNPIKDVGAIGRLAGLLVAEPFDIVHTHTSKGGIIGRAAAMLSCTPAIIHTVHGFAFHEASGRCGTVAYQLVERTAAHWCDLIVTVSEHHARVATQIGIPVDKVVAIPNGLSVPVPAVNPQHVREQLAVGPDTTMLLSVGRLATQKGLEHLIRATSLLNDGAHSKYRTVIVGEGELRAPLETLARELSLNGTVRFMGFRTDVADLLAAADMVVLPSLWEGLSISLLEGMAAGKPIVTTSIPSNLEATAGGHAAYLVPPGDVAALAKAVRALAGDPARRERLATAARCRYLSHYSEQAMVASYMRCYESLLSRVTTRSASKGLPGEFAGPVPRPLGREAIGTQVLSGDAGHI